MSTLEKAAQQALEALEMLAQPTKTNSETPRYKAHKAAITALRAALAQQEQEPVAWRDPVTDYIVSVAHRAAWETDYGLAGKGRAATYTEPLYTAPPRREWQGLTDEDISLIDWEKLRTRKDAVCAVEARLREKNNG